MSKEQELQVLRAAAKQLNPKTTLCGAWLQGAIKAFEASPEGVLLEYANILEKAHQDSEAARAEHQRQVEKIKQTDIEHRKVSDAQIATVYESIRKSGEHHVQVLRAAAENIERSIPTR